MRSVVKDVGGCMMTMPQRPLPRPNNKKNNKSDIPIITHLYLSACARSGMISVNPTSAAAARG